MYIDAHQYVLKRLFIVFYSVLKVAFVI